MKAITIYTVDDIEAEPYEFHRCRFVKHKDFEEFLLRFLNPEDLGRAVPGHVRDEIRMALGRKPVESTLK
jgi:hypothetical protein